MVITYLTQFYAKLMIMNKLNLVIFILAILALLGTSCSEDSIPILLIDSSIKVENTTSSTDLSFSYSTDNGITWGSIFPDLTEGANLKVKIVAGTVDLTTLDYAFDWSASNPVPEDPENEIASFTIGQDALSLKVTIFKLINVTSTYTSGDYSGDGTFTYSFSTDDGTSWYKEAPTRLNKGSNVIVKVTDGTNDLTTEEFEFDWSDSSIEPSDTSDAIATFTSVRVDFNVAASITEIEELVVIARADGKLYSINKTTGNLTEIGVIVDNSKAPISGLRALEYDDATGKCFLGSTNDNNAIFYSLDITSGIATILNNNSSNSRIGISGLLMASDGNVLANINSNIVSNSAIVVFNSNTGNDGTHNKLVGVDGAEWSPGGLIYGYSTEELVIGGSGEIYFSDLNATISKIVVLDNPSYVLQTSLVMDLARDKKTPEIYSIMLDVSTNYLHLAKIDINSGKVTWINSLADNNKDNWFHCLAFIPKHRLP